MEKSVELINSGMLRDLWAPSKGECCRRKGPNSLVASNDVPSSGFRLSSPSLPLCQDHHRLQTGKWREPRDFQMPSATGQHSTGHQGRDVSGPLQSSPLQPPRTHSPP